MKSFTLDQVLGPAQLKEVDRIMKSSADSLERTTRLKEYYGTFAEDLERQGIVPDYLAYCTEYAYTKSRMLNAGFNKKGNNYNETDKTQPGQAAGSDQQD